jgi:hypothetical protein
MKIQGSGSISQMHGSADPDPHQNVMDPQHCLSGKGIPVLFLYLCVNHCLMYFLLLAGNTLLHHPLKWFWEGFNRLIPEPTLSETFTRLCRNLDCEKPEQVGTRYLNVNKCVPLGTLWETCFDPHIKFCCCLQLCIGAYIVRNLNNSVPVGTLWETCFDPHINFSCCLHLCIGAYIVINLNKSLPVATLWETCFDPNINCCSCVQVCTGTYIVWTWTSRYP